ncbi:serine/threonine-protein kinase [Streptomyces sp. NPDC059651]|uniref:serine/threonine-protein kinase n=1 Tax=Streptomyces sp. NPDC059651 TaxID=3346897 RepID=UPI0036BB0B12
MERGTMIAGKYELGERLGRGGMGEVWAGRDRDLHRDVAIKLLAHDNDASPDLLHRFEREAVAAAQINHPNVVSLFDRGIHDGLQFLVMERIDGTTLAHHMHRQTPLPLARALEITQEICSALVAAHRAKVVHYDIKPSNVMLTTDGRIKVVDFGIAGFAHSHTFTVVPTTLLAPAGTAHYGAPEQFLDQRGDARSDLYALGSVLFALLAGKPPFGDGSPLSVIRRKLDNETPLLSSVRPDLPHAVVQLVADLLQRDPDRRPHDASVTYERLERLRTSAPTSRAGAGESDIARLPQTAPPRTRPASNEGGAKVNRTGQEPSAVHAARDSWSLRRHWSVFAILVLPFLYAGAGLLTLAITDDPQADNLSDLPIVIVCWVLYPVILYVLYGRKLVAATLARKRHQRGR